MKEYALLRAWLICLFDDWLQSDAELIASQKWMFYLDLILKEVYINLRKKFSKIIPKMLWF